MSERSTAPADLEIDSSGAGAVSGTASIAANASVMMPTSASAVVRSEEHTSELQSQFHLVCRLLLEKKKKKKQNKNHTATGKLSISTNIHINKPHNNTR